MINTFSIFYYGHNVTTLSQNLPFDEGVGEVNGQVAISGYAISEVATAVQTALNAASVTRVFTVTLDRDTRKFTIAADGTFDLLLSTGSTVGTSIFSLLGFTTGSDLTAASSYESDSASGSAYEPQFKLQSYVDEEDFREASQANVNQSASGLIEVVSFGINRFFEMDFKWITNIAQDCNVIKNNPSGVSAARLFLRDITERRKFEFIPDIGDRATFFKVILDRIPGNSTATGYKLKELFGRNLPGYYETGIIRLRVVS